MKPGMEIERSNFSQDCVVFTTLFSDKQDYWDFHYTVSFDLQKTFKGDVLFSVYNKNIMRNLLYEQKAIDSLPLIEALIETKTMIIRAMYEDNTGNQNLFLEGVEHYNLEDWDIENLISIRDTVLQIVNYGGGFSGAGN